MTTTEQYRVILTEGGYTTADGPMTRAAALEDFSRWARYVGPLSGNRLRVVADPEYRRLLGSGLILGDVA
jgi:hypothetical protein